jgi:hypothetical protein
MNPVDKFNFYLGFTNGYFALRGQKGLELAACLENMGSTQAIAMIDKRYKDHPEKWSSAIGMEVLTGLTV